MIHRPTKLIDMKVLLKTLMRIWTAEIVPKRFELDESQFQVSSMLTIKC